MTELHCPACGKSAVTIFHEQLQVPVHQNLLYPTEAAARSTIRGDIRLGFCHACGFVTNTAFNPDLLNYSEQYDNTQSYSPLFNQYVIDLADTLIDRYDLHDKHIVEIGCGKGGFIKLLCERGPNRGVGFDPSYIGDLTDETGRVTFIRDFFSERYADTYGQLFCSRHVIEHIQHPADMLNTLRRAIGDRRDTALFTETPDVSWILKNVTVWDIFYEHCSLFSPGSIARLYAACGFDVTHITSAFDGQYMWAEGVPGAGRIRVDIEPVEEMAELVEHFSSGYRGQVQTLQGIFESMVGKRAVVWGAGAKGVTLLNLLNVPASLLPYVVDINPQKQGKYIPGTAQQIISPAFLKDYEPDMIFIMNPNYADEIRASLQRDGLYPEIITL